VSTDSGIYVASWVGPVSVWRPCAECGEKFEANWKPGKRYCSRSCGTKAAWKRRRSAK
jgi:ABC-type ATPase with predicted acetyltransferase domain